jgi:gliding motility-associated-like protein
MKNRLIHFFLIVYYIFTFNNTSLISQTVVLKGGGMVIQSGVSLVIQGDLIIRDEASTGKINLDGSILLDNNIVNESTDSVFTMTGANPNGWLIMRNTINPQQIVGMTPISFENLTLYGSEKILMNPFSKVNGILRLNSKFNLNSETFILNNKSSNSIDYLGGYLYAETSPIDGYGIFQWNIGDNLATYSVPFGSGNATNSDLKVTFETTSIGNQTGNIRFSTYPTENTNDPLPTAVTNLNPFNPLQTIDRFWLIDGDGYFQKPTSNISLKYLNSELNNGNNIDQNLLSPIVYKTSTNNWESHLIYQNDMSNNIMMINSVSGENLDKNWTLSSESSAREIFFPNAFSPDMDGNNDEFKPVMNFTPNNYALYIYDQWGNLLFTSKNPNVGWDGKYLNEICTTGIYTWMVEVTKVYNKKYVYTGIVTIIKI